MSIRYLSSLSAVVATVAAGCGDDPPSDPVETTGAELTGASGASGASGAADSDWRVLADNGLEIFDPEGDEQVDGDKTIQEYAALTVEELHERGLKSAYLGAEARTVAGDKATLEAIAVDLDGGEGKVELGDPGGDLANDAKNVAQGLCGELPKELREGALPLDSLDNTLRVRSELDAVTVVFEGKILCVVRQ